MAIIFVKPKGQLLIHNEESLSSNYHWASRGNFAPFEGLILFVSWTMELSIYLDICELMLGIKGGFLILEFACISVVDFASQQ